MHAGESESVSRTVCDVTVLGCPSSNSSSRTPATRERDRISPLSLSLSIHAHYRRFPIYCYHGNRNNSTTATPPYSCYSSPISSFCVVWDLPIFFPSLSLSRPIFCLSILLFFCRGCSCPPVQCRHLSLPSNRLFVGLFTHALGFQHRAAVLFFGWAPFRRLSNESRSDINIIQSIPLTVRLYYHVSWAAHLKPFK